MPSQNPIPPLLRPSIASSVRRKGSVLLTGTINSSTDWLVLRFIHAAVHQDDADSAATLSTTDIASQTRKVILLSWLHSQEYWTEAAQRTVSTPSAFAGRYLVSGLFSQADKAKGIDVRQVDFLSGGQTPLSGAETALEHFEKLVTNAAKVSDGVDGNARRHVLILDRLDYLLASTHHAVHDILDFVHELQDIVGTVIVTVSADHALMHAATTSLELAHTTLVVNLAHDFDTIMSLRELDTGSASDVSGVVRVSAKPHEEDSREQVDSARDLLYLVSRDGLVKVFERGA